MMQATTQPQPEAPATPALPPRPTSITTVGADQKPLTLSSPATQEEVEALVRQRSELADQLTSATERRVGLVNQLQSAPDGVARTGIEERIKVLDQRILQLETDLASTGRLVALAPGDLVAIASRNNFAPGGGDDDFEEGMMLGVFLAVGFVALVTAFRRFRRRKQKPVKRTELGVESQRLERLEQGMEAIAIEIERVSEGQRFVTKLLSEKETPVR
ncbi:MAG TPA: hypothetical protein VGC52_10610 [Gemmatimonadaceae bacterium]